MHLARLISTRRFACAVIAIVLLHGIAGTHRGVAQDVTEPALKAAFIYNFVRFTEWPDALPSADPFVMCVLGDAGVGDALEQTVRGREIAGHPIVVSRSATAGPKQPCHVLYVSGAMTRQRVELINGLRDAPVLTIGDMDGFNDIGGIVQFFFEHGRLRFSIRRESATRAGLQISARLLMLSQQYE